MLHPVFDASISTGGTERATVAHTTPIGRSNVGWRSFSGQLPTASGTTRPYSSSIHAFNDATDCSRLLATISAAVVNFHGSAARFIVSVDNPRKSPNRNRWRP